jgi:adhesin HecA-like repeat protein
MTMTTTFARSLARPLVVLALALSASPALAQVCTQPITLRTSACPPGATTCTTKGTTLTFSDMDSNLINVNNLCNAIPGPPAIKYNVKSFPYLAQGDNTTDDTVAIQSAVNAAISAGGGIVYLPEGKFKASNLTVTGPGVYLVGAGVGATSIVTTATTGDVVAFGNTSAVFSPCGGMRDLSITSSVTRTAGAALTVDGCQDGWFNNLWINPTGGDGIHLAPTNHLAAILFFNRINITVHGAFKGILIQGGNDRYFTDLWVTGDLTAGSTAIEMQNSLGDWFTNVEAVSSDYGVLIDPGNGQSATWGNWTNLLADTNNINGIRIVQTGTGFVWLQTFIAPWTSSNGFTSASGRGIYIGTGSALDFTAARVVNNGGHGIEIAGGTGISISGAKIVSNSQQSHGSFDGINVNSSASGFRVEGSLLASGGIGGTVQRYGVNIAAGSDNYLITDNDITGNGTGAINNVPGLSSTRRVYGNLPYDSTAGADGMPLGSNYVTSAQIRQSVGTSVIGNSTGSAGNVADIVAASDNSVLRRVSGALGWGLITNGMLNDSYSGVGACAANNVVTGLNADAAPTCSVVPSTLSATGGNSITTSTSSAATITITEDDATSAGPLVDEIKSRSGGPAAVNDGGGAFRGRFRNSASAIVTAMNLAATITNVTAGSEAADISVIEMVGGTPSTPIKLHNGQFVQGSVPTSMSVACTGTGTSPTAPTIAGADKWFTITMSTGTGSPGSTGTCTVTFANAYVANLTAFPVLVCTLQDGASAWSNEAVIRVSTKSLTAPVLTWTNEASGVLTGLAVSSSYQISCFVGG